MKKVLISALVAASVVALSTVASAKILGSHHDLSRGNAAKSSYTQAAGPSACEYCHAPHNIGKNGAANEVQNAQGVDRAPLWNRKLPTGFTAYGKTVSSETTAAGTNVQSADIGANSATCLSCHDGVTGLSTLASYNYWGNQGAAASGNWDGAGKNITTDANLGTDLRDDHPVGFAFVNERAGVPSSVFTGNTLTAEEGANSFGGKIRFWLYDGKFECASCHDPHDTTTGAVGKAAGNSPDASLRGGSNFFLRAPIGSICTDCHANK